MSSFLDRLFVFIMAGGSGERFWPKSRRSMPKHLLKLLSDQTLLEQTVRRFERVIPMEQIFVLTNIDQREATQSAVPFLPATNIIVEPVKRDTAPAAALATGLAKRARSDAIIAIFPADAVIYDTLTFQRQIKEAVAFVAENSSLLTFSITPTHPSTAFGYLQLQSAISSRGGTRIVSVKRFIEKPDAENAKKFFIDKKYGWNAGIFMWQADAFVKECRQYQPELEKFIFGFPPSGSVSNYLAKSFAALPKVSVDVAIMEKTTNIVAAIAEYDWDDVGSWTALPDHLGKDAQENTLSGSVTCFNAHRNIVVAGKRTVALCGVSDLVVVETDDAILVCHREAVQQIKNLSIPRDLT